MSSRGGCAVKSAVSPCLPRDARGSPRLTSHSRSGMARLQAADLGRGSANGMIEALMGALRSGLCRPVATQGQVRAVAGRRGRGPVRGRDRHGQPVPGRIAQVVATSSGLLFAVLAGVYDDLDAPDLGPGPALTLQENRAKAVVVGEKTPAPRGSSRPATAPHLGRGLARPRAALVGWRATSPTSPPT
jgi:hypothetical protein